MTDGASSRLQIETDATSVEGTFTREGSTVTFRSESRDEQYAALHLDINGVPLDVELELDSQRFSEDGHGRSLYEVDLAALLTLRDRLLTDHPDLMHTLHGALLIREVDRFAEVPIGLTLDLHVVDLAAKGQPDSQLTGPGCLDDGVTCLPGTSGGAWAVYDEGSNGTCTWKSTSYGGSGCYGRCGAGCNWLDNDYTWDCLDHDRCLDAFGGSSLSGNVHCGDEFWDAADDYVATLAPLCWSGSNRTPPPMPRCGDGTTDAGEECDDRNTTSGDGCSATCLHELRSIAISPEPIVIDQRERLQLRAVGTFLDNTTRDVTASVTWTTTSNVATIDGGRLDGQQSGTTTVRAAMGTVAGTASVSVSVRTCHITINEVQSGGVTGADEWVELYNGCSEAIAVDGWTLVYRAASAIGATDSAVLASLAGTMAPGELRLYSSASAPGAIVAAASGTWSLNGGNGQLQQSAAAVGLRAGPASSGPVVDAIGYGVAAGHPFAEGGASAPALANGKSTSRAPRDGRDTDVNATDFVLGGPTPRASNFASP